MRKKLYSGMDSESAAAAIDKAISLQVRGIRGKIAARTYWASNELKTASIYVLRGKRSGRIYRVPFTKQKYQASAAGESPAVRIGAFMLSWKIHSSVQKNDLQFRTMASIESSIKVGSYLLGDILEDGTSKMDKRPYKQKIINMAMPKIMEKYKNL